MQTLSLEPRALVADAFKQRTAQMADVSTVVDGDLMVYDGPLHEDRLRLIYLSDIREHYPTDAAAYDAEVVLRRIGDALPHVPFMSDWRTSGLKSLSRTFGYKPRNVLRHDFCNRATMANVPGQRAAHDLLCHGATLIDPVYARYAPQRYVHHLGQATKVLPEYRLSETPFTSGIANCDNPIWHHRDAGNFPGEWSAQLTFRRGVEDGFLVVPQLDIVLRLAHWSLLLFDGQTLVHGVTPLTIPGGDAHRFSVVYFSLKGMWHCQPMAEEITRIRRKRTEREYKRAAPVAGKQDA